MEVQTGAGLPQAVPEYGMEIVMVCAKHCLTKRALAAEAGIADSLLATIKRPPQPTTSRPPYHIAARYEASAKRSGGGKSRSA